MKPNTYLLAKRYAKAYDGLAKNAKQAAANLQAYGAALDALGEAAYYINSPALSFDIKAALLDKILGDGAASAFIKVLARAKRFYLAGIVREELSALLDNRLGIKRAEVKAASKISAAQQEALGAALNAYFSASVEAEYEVDKSLLAGITVRQGDTFLDGSARGRFVRLTKILTGK